MFKFHFRRYARELSMQIIFSYDIQDKLIKNETVCDDLINYLQDLVILLNFKDLTYKYSHRIFRETLKITNGIFNHIEEIDSLIERFSINWTMGRIDLISKSIIRVAIYEILYCSNISINVSINESIEICKKYCASSDSYMFINGILNTIKEDVIKK